MSTSKSEWRSPDAVRAWWASEHQSFYKRNWTAEQIVNLRDPIQVGVIANDQALKLRKMFAARQAEGSGSLTYAASDAIVGHLMGEAGLDMLYVSGFATSLTDVPTFAPSADMADYPYTAVPKKVKELFAAQLLHSRVDTNWKTEGVDRMIPIIADADSGHGAPTVVMKLTRLFVESGASAIHIDDLYSGVKKFAAPVRSHVLVPVSEHRQRLMAAKLQLDMMGSEMMLIHRTDCEQASHITSTIDANDRPFILGCTNPELNGLLAAKRAGTSEEDWNAAANLKSLDEAVKEVASEEVYAKYLSETKGLNVSDALRWTKKAGIAVYWDTDATRTAEGWYRYNGCIESSIMRSIVLSGYADMVWSCTPALIRPDVETYASAVQKALPGKLMGYNWTGPFMGGNPTDEQVEALQGELGKMGYVFQFLPMGGQATEALACKAFATAVKEKGLLAYLNQVIRENEKIGGVSVLNWHAQTSTMTDVFGDAVRQS